MTHDPTKSKDDLCQELAVLCGDIDQGDLTSDKL